jgi:Fe-S cluster assembly iron-binding protein IscA
MALDEPNEKDQEFDIDGYKYIVEKDFLERAQPIKVDFHMYGFKLESGMDFGAGSGCSGCGSGSNSCSV